MDQQGKCKLAVDECVRAFFMGGCSSSEPWKLVVIPDCDLMHVGLNLNTLRDFWAELIVKRWTSNGRVRMIVGFDHFLGPEKVPGEVGHDLVDIWVKLTGM